MENRTGKIRFNCEKFIFVCVFTFWPVTQSSSSSPWPSFIHDNFSSLSCILEIRSENGVTTMPVAFRWIFLQMKNPLIDNADEKPQRNRGWGNVKQFSSHNWVRNMPLFFGQTSTVGVWFLGQRFPFWSPKKAYFP